MAGSRLDRLIALLETGSTQSIRLTAARQLAGIAGVRVSHPSTEKSGHPSLASTVKVEDATQPASYEGVWRGVDGEWNEVLGLVARVLPLLQSRSMETRQAAASALGMISRAVGIWDPSRTETSETVPLDGPSASTTNSINPMSLSDFDVARVLRDGQLLLASSGKEYGKLSQLTAAELEQAHKDVMKNLGLGMGAGMDDIGVDVSAELASDAPVAESAAVASTTDPARPALPPPRFKPATTVGSTSQITKSSASTAIAASASSSTVSSPAASAAPESPAAPTDADPYAGLSARERNKLKRKRKAEGKAGLAPSPAPQPAAKKAKVAAAPASAPAQQEPIPSLSSVDNTNGIKTEGIEEETKIVIDPAAKAKERERQGGEIQAKAEAEQAQTEVKAGEWPWRAVVERLSVGLLAPGWETRHGASLGLRELLRLQASGGGKVEGVSHAQNTALHRVWVEDLATKLLYVFALDRFGDYVSDQVIAPVRETAAQALAVLLPSMSASSSQQVRRILADMVHQRADASAPPPEPSKPKYIWQVRHSALLGLKYVVAVQGRELLSAPPLVKTEEGDVKPDLASLEVPLKHITDAALVGLRDRDDDVRAAAAATLAPVAHDVVAGLPSELHELLEVLWSCLGDLKDDLASSVGGVMDLLSKLLEHPSVLTHLQSPAMSTPLPTLIPRLFAFFRHTITSVRLAVVRTFLVFLRLPTLPPTWLDATFCRLLFQNLLVEERGDIREATSDAWTACLERVGPSLPTLVASQISDWFDLLNTQIGTAIDRRLLWFGGSGSSGQEGTVYSVDKPMLNQDLSLVTVESILRCRVAAATAIGALLAAWPGVLPVDFSAQIETGLQSASALNRTLAAVVVEEWASRTIAKGMPVDTALAATFVRPLHNLLAADPPAAYQETAPILQRLRSDCANLYACFTSDGKVPADRMPSTSEPFARDQAEMVVKSYAALVALVPVKSKKTAVPLVEERYQQILGALAYHDGAKNRYDRQVFAAVGSAVIALKSIPAKITPLIRSVTNSIKMEDNPDLQARAASAIAALIDLCTAPDTTMRVNPAPKLVGNLCAFLCQDVTLTPLFASAKASSAGVLSLAKDPARGAAEKSSKGKQETVNEADEATKLVYRGAQQALAALARRFGESLLTRVPKLWSCMADPLLQTYGQGTVADADGFLRGDDRKGQDLLDSLTVLPVVARHLVPALHPRLTSLLPALAVASRSSFAVVRYAVAQSFAAISDVVPTEALRQIVEIVIPVLADPLHLDHRRGAMETIARIVDVLDIKILPYVIFLVVPVLGRMSDPDDDVRFLATRTFATLVKLVPLESGLPDPPGFSAELLAKRDFEREFLMQLLDGSKVAEYDIPVDMGIKLRKYQRDGVSWLAFLARYQLHGLLCDDMGLGKTLQSITILASMHHERAERYHQTKSPDAVHLPSLVICPPTLTGHWLLEINTYAKALRAVIYTGPRAERERLVRHLRDYDVVIMSYDVARNDVEMLGPTDWHYVILDEGHIIKNGKTKLARAVKTYKAIHRLILSGTPIQNNVLELWSLFDFLMPGFLGSEKAFNDRFGKPIAASRDAKSSSKEQEAGTLALEALHKQVLPFILRRLKEDVLDDLPPKIIQDYHVELSPVQKQLYDDFSNSQGKQLAVGEVSSSANSAQKPQHVFQALQYLRKLVNHPALVYKPDLPQHQAALVKAAGPDASIHDIAHAPKIRALQQILLDCGIGNSDSSATVDGAGTDGAVPQHRALIFCQLKTMLDIVEHDLLRKLMPDVTYMRLDGTTDVSKRHAVCQTFNSDPSIDCLLLTTHVGGLGLNLTGADTVIFVEHDWNPMRDLQAMDRAHRLGQKKVVNVYRLIMRGTLEEKIMGLQRFKLNVASTVVSQQNSDLDSLGTDQILDLFQVSDTPAKAAADADGDKPMSQKAILESLDDLPTDVDYGDLDVSSFMASLV
ncbi:hypothetical protein JCM10908_005340 [Rhodotorula pacifica]|uniref:DNA-binding ATPase n=1 Tax=Rhodotorula pacifica TaxID=1495444 RepID=UPI00317084CA